MKTLFTFLLIYLAIGFTNAQIPGGNFENWNSYVFEYPEYSNINNYIDENTSKETYGVLEKTTDASDGTYALKFSSFGTDYFGYVLYGYMVGDNPGAGIPFADDPTQVTISYKCNMAENDSAQIFVWLYSEGTQVTSDIFKVGGNHAEYTDTIFNLSPYTAVIDSMLFALVSDNPFEEKIRTNGNVVYFDNIRFNGSNNVQIPDNSFENWGSITREFTDEMYFIKADVEKSTDAYNGDFALKMTTHEVNWDEAEQQVQMENQLALWGDLDWINTGGDNWDVHTVGGLPVEERNDTLVFYYKYEPMPGVKDTASVLLRFSKNGSEVYNAYHELLPSSAYQKLEIPFNLDYGWDGNPIDADSMVLSFETSKWRNKWNPSDVDVEGSSLYIDYMYFQSDLFTQTVSYGANGIISPETTNVLRGSSITFTITPDNGYEIATITYNSADVKGDLVQVGNSSSYTINNVSTNGLLEAEFSLISGTEEFDYQNGKISFYPNPSADKLTFRGIDNGSLVELYSTTGILVYQNRINSNAQIDISAISEGVYLLKINNNLIGKIIKQ